MSKGEQQEGGALGGTEGGRRPTGVPSQRGRPEGGSVGAETVLEYEAETRSSAPDIAWGTTRCIKPGVRGGSVSIGEVAR